MEASSSNQQFCLRWNNHKTNLLAAFTELWHNGSFADVSFIVERGTSFVTLDCHKMVLAASSEYFEDMFAQSDEKHPTIIVPGLREAEMRPILEYMYQGEVSVSQAEMANVFKVAQLLKVKGLAEFDKSEAAQGCSMSVSPPPAITSSDRRPSFGNDSRHQAYRSPPPSAYYPYNKASALAQLQQSQLAATWNPLTSLSLAAHMHSPLASRAPALYHGVYEDNHVRNAVNGLLMNPDTPILRNVLGKGHADSSQALPPTDHDVYRSSSNGSAHDMDDAHSTSIDMSQGEIGNGPYGVQVSIEEGDRKPPARGVKPKEWKRYKQYTKEHMTNAIIAVKRGETALKAAKTYGIPSRTLYDKVKKMGIVTQRYLRRVREANSRARFPHGIGGNRHGDIYGEGVDHHDQTENRRASEESVDHEGSLDNSLNPMSPDDEHDQHDQLEIGVEESDDDQVQDLSMNRRNVIVPGPHAGITI